jgi:hypothetical protein
MKSLAIRSASVLACAVMATSFMPFPADAAQILRTYNLMGSDFSPSFGDGSTPPLVSAAALDFTINFDNAADILTSTAGLSINSFNLPYSLAYSYSADFDLLNIATVPIGPSTCSNPPNSFCAFILDASGPAPTLLFIQQTPDGDDGWVAQTTSLTVGGSGSAIPEPATWLMLLFGFASVGTVLRAVGAPRCGRAASTRN